MPPPHSFTLYFAAVLITSVLTTHASADEPMIVAHRGASYDAPENTLPSFELAWARGADAVEGDFYLTRDGHVVCCHDKSTKRYADRDLIVSQSTLAELQALDVGRWKAPQYTGTWMPTLSQVLASVPDGKRIYVEVKCGPEIMAPMLQAFDKSNLQPQQIVVISFNAHVIESLKRLAPKYKAYWLSGFKETTDNQFSPSVDEVLKTLNRTQADGFSSTKDLIDEAFIDQVQAAGFEYHVWTVDDGRTARRFREWGAESITTNRPAFIRGRLKRAPAPAVQLGL